MASHNKSGENCTNIKYNHKFSSFHWIPSAGIVWLLWNLDAIMCCSFRLPPLKTFFCLQQNNASDSMYLSIWKSCSSQVIILLFATYFLDLFSQRRQRRRHRRNVPNKRILSFRIATQSRKLLLQRATNETGDVCLRWVGCCEFSF